MDDLRSMTIGDIVAHNYSTASVFQSLGIDYSCKGSRLLDEVCEARNLEINVLIEDLEASINQASIYPDYRTWSLDKLADHIVKHHHGYIEKNIPVIKLFIEKITVAYGKQFPELLEISELFNTSAGELTMHMKKEELILFPFIRKMSLADQNGEGITPPPFGNVENPIAMMEHEHDMEIERFKKIRELSHDYTIQVVGDRTLISTFELLKEFEEDLSLHIHLENNILFPGAITLQKSLNKLNN